MPGPTEILIVLGIVLLLFGGRKIGWRPYAVDGPHARTSLAAGQVDDGYRCWRRRCVDLLS